MTPKKKPAATSSESNSSSSSNTSSSSTSSSSTSGSDSSSSDTDNSSTSRATASKSVRAASTDSETVKTKKKTPAAKNTKAVESEKQKENKSKVRPLKPSAVYSSESEDPPTTKVALKRKANSKPKPAATVTVVPKQKVTKATPNPKPGPTARKSAKETAALKKLKSIFSPENSSESDDFVKLPPIKASAASKALTKQKPKAAAPVIASVSSCNATSSSFYSSDSDDSAFEKPINRKKAVKKKPAPPAPRKLTRSSNARQSKHVMCKASDSESETEIKQVAAKQANATASRQNKSPRKVKGRANKTEMAVGERLCPILGCDSKGHLGGKFETHFTMEACPKYHNKSVLQCTEFRSLRLAKEEERKKAVVAYNLRPNVLTQEQKNYLAKVKDMRKQPPVISAADAENIDRNRGRSGEDKQRQPNLIGVAPDYDLGLFEEAQTTASEKLEEELLKLPHVKGTKYVEMGKYEMEVWYQSPYPDSFNRTPKLFLCEYCLRYMKSRTILNRHASKCVWRHPPGEEVYRKEKISVWEVDGRKYKLYSQNLCLLAKFFLDHKTLYYDVEPFLFYVMTIGDTEGCHTVGYFSKEKNSFLNYNVSCILTLPPYQRQGYGRLLIDFSYLLTRVEGKIGSPEKPLSDLGLISYRSYWKDVLLGYLCNNQSRQLSIKDISQEMAINSYDIVSTLQALEMLKYWKGKHIILKKPDVLEEYVERTRRRGSVYKEIDPAYLKWTPFVAPAPQGTGV